MDQVLQTSSLPLCCLAIDCRNCAPPTHGGAALDLDRGDFLPFRVNLRGPWLGPAFRGSPNFILPILFAAFSMACRLPINEELALAWAPFVRIGVTYLTEGQQVLIQRIGEF